MAKAVVSCCPMNIWLGQVVLCLVYLGPIVGVVQNHQFVNFFKAIPLICVLWE